MNYISVTNSNNGTTWTKQLTDDEYQNTHDYSKSKNTVSLLAGTIKPVRTNSLSNFATDFFLPTTINHANKVQNIVVKIFALLASLVLDILTLPIRLLTFLPRIYFNSKQEETSLHKYLKEQGVDSTLVNSDYVNVKLYCMGTKRWEKFHVNFVEVPVYRGAFVKCFGLSSEGDSSNINQDKEMYESACDLNKPMHLYVPTLST